MVYLSGNDSCLLKHLIEAIRQAKEASCALKAHRYMSQCLVYFINYNCHNFVTQLTLIWIYRDLLQRDRTLRAQQDKEFQASVSFIDHKWNWKHWIDLELCTKDSLICIHHLFTGSQIAVCTRKTNIRYIDVNCHQKKKSWCIFFNS